jgi:hypothetical protein
VAVDLVEDATVGRIRKKLAPPSGVDQWHFCYCNFNFNCNLKNAPKPPLVIVMIFKTF